MKKHPRKIGAIVIVLIAAGALTQSGQHGQISAFFGRQIETTR